MSPEALQAALTAVEAHLKAAEAEHEDAIVQRDRAEELLRLTRANVEATLLRCNQLSDAHDDLEAMQGDISDLVRAEQQHVEEQAQ